MTIRARTSLAVLLGVAAVLVSACQNASSGDASNINKANSSVGVANTSPTPTPTVTYTVAPSTTATPTPVPAPTASTATPTVAPATVFCEHVGPKFDTYALADQPSAWVFYVRKGGDGQPGLQAQTPTWRHWTVVPDGVTNPFDSSIRIEGDSGWFKPVDFFALGRAAEAEYASNFFPNYVGQWKAAVGVSGLCQ